jgi:NAD(P)-dependent dehydrogenase (short-subunit alcohol dehydrogenase family)
MKSQRQPLVHVTRGAAIELGEKGVWVSSISPGPTLAGIFVKARGANSDAADQRTREIETAFKSVLPPLKRFPGMIQAENIAAASAFLASDDPRYRRSRSNCRWRYSGGNASLDHDSNAAQEHMTLVSCNEFA